MVITDFFISQPERDELFELLRAAREQGGVDPEGENPTLDENRVPIATPGSYEPVYRFLINITRPSPFESVTQTDEAKLTHRFLRGARQVNSDIGFYSDWVRGYTQRQIELRTTSDQDLVGWNQYASDQIIDAIAQSILDSFDNPTAIGHIPTTEEIALRDANAAVTRVFDVLPVGFRTDDTGAGVIGAAWAGTPFFADIGSPKQITRLLESPNTQEELNLDDLPEFSNLDDLRNMLFAHASMVFGLEEIARLDSVLDFIPARAVIRELRESVKDDPSVLSSSFEGMRKLFYQATVDGDFRVQAGTAELLSQFAEVGDYNEMAEIFETIGQIGSGPLLDNIRSSYLGNVQLGTSNDSADFLAASREFFLNVLTNDELLNTPTELIANLTVSQLVARGLQDVEIRNALMGLSNVALTLPNLDDRPLDLYDQQTGEGRLSSAWMQDRSNMLKVKAYFDEIELDYDFLLTRTIFPGLTGIHFEDRPSNLTLKVDQQFSPEPPNYVIFGGDGVDEIDGNSQNDNLYGGDGFDIINGMAGDDRLEGGNGEDTLSGGIGNDVLIGGADNDRLDAGKGHLDYAEGGAGDDVYVFETGDQYLRIFDADKAGSVEVTGIAPMTVKLGDQTINRIPGSDSRYMDDLGTEYEFKNSQLTVTLASGDVIQIDAFASGDLGIVLGPAVTIDVPEVQPGAVQYNVDFVARPTPPNIHGQYASGSVPIWSSWGAITDSTASEEIFANSLSGNAYSQVIAGPGDSVITGDDGFNNLVDDGWSSPSQAGVIYGNDVLRGGDGIDWLTGSFGDDWLFGGDDDSPDLLIDNPDLEWGGTTWISQPENTSDDYLFGGGGGDYQASNGGDDYSDGGSGNDEIYTGAGDDVLIGGDGNDVLSGDTRLTDNPIVAGGQVGSVTFTFDGNFIDGEQTEYGDDTLVGGLGTDSLYGGGGNDSLSGGDGDDYLQGDFMLAAPGSRQGLLDHSADDEEIHGDDTISGGDGNDVAYGGGGDDLILGGAGNDFIFGDWDEANTGYSLDSQYHGDDVLFGGDGDDVIAGNSGSDTLHGQDGDDQLTGGEGADELSGGNGTDSLFGGDGEDVLEGGAGDDQLVGGDDGDNLSGGDGADQLFGGLGDDILLGGDGQDVLHGDDGDDVLIADRGDDRLFGGAGSDTFVISSGAGAVQITDTAGVSTLQLGLGIEADGLSITVSNSLIFIDLGAGDSILTNASTFAGFEVVEFADGTTLNPDELFAMFKPGSSSGFELGGDADVSDLSYFVQDNDLVIQYAGSDPNWIDEQSLSDGNILFRQGLAGDFGLPGTQQTIVLANWLVGQSGSYVNSISDSSGGSLFLPSQDSVPRNFVGTDDGGQQDGGSGDDVLVGGAGMDILNGGDGNDDYAPGSNLDLITDTGGDDVYRIEQDSGFILISDQEGGGDRIEFGSGIEPASISLEETALGLEITIGDPENENTVIVTDWSNSTNTVETFAFADGTDWDLATIEANIVGNRSPDIDNQLADLRVADDQTFSFTLPSDLFSDPNGDTLSVDIDNLPFWMSFDQDTQTISGTPGVSQRGQKFEFEIVATDPDGLTQSMPVAIVVPIVRTGTEGDDRITLSTSSFDVFALGGSDTVFGSNGDDYIDGGPGNDWLLSGLGDNTLIGGEGDDRLSTSSSGRNTVIGGVGNDEIQSQSGDDTFVFNIGDGTDTLRYFLNGEQGNNRIQFGPGILSTDVLSGLRVMEDPIEENGFYVLLQYNPTDPNDVVRVNFRRDLDSEATHGPVTLRDRFLTTIIEFSNGETLNLGELFDQVNTATEGDDILAATPSAPELFGLGGNDRLYAGGGINATLSGGAGDDVLNAEFAGPSVLNGDAGNDLLITSAEGDLLNGGIGDDIYTFRTAGSSLESTVITDASGFDVIDFSAAISFDAFNALDGKFTVVRSGNDLIFRSISGGSDAVTVTGWYTGTENRIERFLATENAQLVAYTAEQIEGLVSGVNTAPIVNAPLVDQAVLVDDSLSYTFGSRAFLDTFLFVGPQLQYSAELLGGGALPTWLSFDSSTRTFSGTPQAGDVGTVDVQVTATDPQGLFVTDIVSFTVGSDINVITGTAQDDILIGTEGVDQIFGGEGNDTIRAMGDSDTAFGEAGDDLLVGGTGDDILDGGDGADDIRGNSGNDDINAGSGDDVVIGQGGDDTIRGELGADNLDGGGGADTIFGGDGEDIITGQGGTDTIYGDAGNDSLDGGAGMDTLFGGEGLDTIAGGLGSDEIFGGDGGDTLFGGEGNDDIHGESGDDTITGGAGRDFLVGDAGADSINGGDDNDEIYGDSSLFPFDTAGGNDAIDGGSGNDDIYSGGGSDDVLGGDGNDLISTGAGDDIVDGEAGADRIFGGDDNDTLAGGQGDDTIEGGTGEDTIDGGADNDLLRGEDGDDVLIGGTGDDTLIGGNGSDSLDGGEGVDDIRAGADDDTVVAGGGNDIVLGQGGADNIQGNSGDDNLDGGGGTDTITGGDGMDTIIGAGGADILSGGNDNDTISGGSGGDEIRGDAGDDNLDGDLGADTIFGDDGLDTIAGGDGGDIVFGGNDNDLIFGGDGNDELHGDAGDDTVNGDTGRDRLFGEDGNDTLSGGVGDDVLEGGLGADVLNGGDDNDTLRGDDGNDQLFGEAGDDLLVGGAGDDTIDGGDGADDIRGNAGDDTITAGVGNDIVLGQGGADTIHGDAGDDDLDGGGGADTLFGGDGNDTIAGGAGADTLSGGEGADTYLFNPNNGNDTIDNISVDSEVDRLVIGGGVTTDQLQFERVGDNLRVSVDGQSGRVDVENWFISTTQEVNFVETSADGESLSAAAINALFSAGSSAQSAVAAPPDANQLVLPASLLQGQSENESRSYWLERQEVYRQFPHGQFGMSFGYSSLNSFAWLADVSRRRFATVPGADQRDSVVSPEAEFFNPYSDRNRISFGSGPKLRPAGADQFNDPNSLQSVAMLNLEEAGLVWDGIPMGSGPKIASEIDALIGHPDSLGSDPKLHPAEYELVRESKPYGSGLRYRDWDISSDSVVDYRADFAVPTRDLSEYGLNREYERLTNQFVNFVAAYPEEKDGVGTGLSGDDVENDEFNAVSIAVSSCTHPAY